MNNKPQPDPRNIGYCKGFVDGYEEGVSNNPYDGWEKHFAYNHAQYKIGYDAGVAVYCQQEYPEESK